MEEIKRRIEILDDALSHFRNQSIMSVPNCEFYCLQLRKIYELISFATLSANRERYARIRISYEKDWDISRITKFIENVNPRFLPVAITETPTEDPKILYEIVEKVGPKLDRREFVRRHGIISDMIHAQNPYRKSPDYRVWFERVAKWRDEIVDMLSIHQAIIDEYTFYRVVMNAVGTGKVQVAVMTAVGKQGK